MGDRVSVAFKNGRSTSITLFNHWGGIEFAEVALIYAQELQSRHSGQLRPLDRMEPEVVMVDFIHHVTRDMQEVNSTLYLGVDEHDGDNSDNGHFIIDIGARPANCNRPVRRRDEDED